MVHRKTEGFNEVVALIERRISYYIQLQLLTLVPSLYEFSADRELRNLLESLKHSSMKDVVKKKKDRSAEPTATRSSEVNVASCLLVPSSAYCRAVYGQWHYWHCARKGGLSQSHDPKQ